MLGASTVKLEFKNLNDKGLLNNSKSKEVYNCAVWGKGSFAFKDPWIQELWTLL